MIKPNFERNIDENLTGSEREIALLKVENQYIEMLQEQSQDVIERRNKAIRKLQLFTLALALVNVATLVLK